MKDTDRILLARHNTVHVWMVISNQRPGGHPEYLMSAILWNESIPYVEHESCGVIYRMISRDRVAEYGVPADSPGVSPEAHEMARESAKP